MDTLPRQTRIAVLWIVAAVAMSAHMILMLLDPTALQKAGEWAAAAATTDWISTAAFWLLPLWMAMVSMAAGTQANRWANVVAGALLTLLNIYHFLVCGVPVLPGGPYEEPTAHHVLLVGTSAAATALVTWFAWTWPRKGA